MVVLILEKVPIGLRGELSRWMLEPKSGIFVGSVSGMVRDRLWDKACHDSKNGGCIMIHDSNTEQGFVIRSSGKSSRSLEDFEGLFLVRIPQ
ncbi:MAG: type I-E CRISPR-associated endoribonuclease Cas2 [Desulfomonile tiedjei]|uniref:Type I-E CRISPR-associated endoribonuclease Cas2 n=1 Tax=Desulfomonile tiedjei TaxID=2358 RepID=A0A9D6UYN3_9BACT|nr:type I-E CRISPR-associated endoribonuclease Cas2 [Desulfomonile tiedjei]